MNLLKTPELAKLLGYTPNWVRINAGKLKIPRVKVGNAWRYPEEEVMKWIAKNGENINEHHD